MRSRAILRLLGKFAAFTDSQRRPPLTGDERTFNILNMRSADLTAHARIREAAIEQFGRHGFGVGLRAIAEAAGVSAALVIHHFGSKEGLRKACDDFVAEEIRSSKAAALKSTTRPPGSRRWPRSNPTHR